MRGERQRTEVEDPVTGVTRSFSGHNDWEYSFDFRQDLPSLQLAWGAEYNRDDLRTVYRVTETQSFGPLDGFLDLYLETTRFMGVTMRFQVGNAAEATFTRRSDRYGLVTDPTDIDGDGEIGYVPTVRTTAAPDFSEIRLRQMGRFYSLRISGSF
jgi:hypothetical protein